MKLTKTERKLLDAAKADIYNRAGYDGLREANAARKLEKAGLVRRIPCDGHYMVRSRMGYRTGYYPQGSIELIEKGIK